MLRGNAKPLGREKKRVGRRLRVGVVLGADDGFEAVEKTDRRERTDHRAGAPAGNDGEWNPAVLRIDVLKDFRDRLELRQQAEVEAFLARADGFDGHGETLHGVQRGDDFVHRLAAPCVEQRFIEGAIPFRQGGLPGDVVQRHGVDDGAVAIKKICLERAGGKGQFHAGVGLLADI